MDPKQRAGEAAAGYVRDGMVIGLGTGSTARYAILKLGEMVKEGLDIIGVPTSRSTELLAREVGIRLTSLEEHPKVDLTIDGADEVDSKLNLIKGMGGALVREKIVAKASTRMIVVVDESKMVRVLGKKAPVPVEVVPFGWKVCESLLKDLRSDTELRMTEGRPFVSDNGNYIIDCKFQAIRNPGALERRINSIPGVVDSGIFASIAHLVIVGTASGVKEVRGAT